MNNLYLNITFISLLILIYYRLVKGFIISRVPQLLPTTLWNKKITHRELVGIVELTLIATTHVLFALALITIFAIPSSYLGWDKTTLMSMLDGILLGIAEMGCSTLLGRFMMELLQLIMPLRVPNNFHTWMTTARGGWMRHHIHSLEILPFYVAWLIMLLQIGAEETVFRGVVIPVMLTQGPMAAIIISTLLFMWMQIFFMKNWVSAMFPVIGALVVGVVHGILFIHCHQLLPLIVAHAAFFLFAVAL